MGCGSSKVDDLPVVTLCRERLTFLGEAIQRRYHFADSHRAYLHSLNSVAVSLPRFFNLPVHFSLPPSPSPSFPTNPNPNLNLPPATAGSHLQFLSESDSDGDDDDLSSGSLHPSSPSHHLDYTAHPQTSLDSSFYGGGGKFMNYMQSGGTPSVTYQDSPMNPQTGLSYSYDYYAVGVGGGNRGSFPASAASKPPPSPPRTSPWDSLDIFEAATTSSSAAALAAAAAYPWHSHPHTPGRNSEEVREEEGIPDLEDSEHVGGDDDDEEVVKQVRGNPKLADGGTSVPAGGGSGVGDGEAIYHRHQQQQGRGGRPSTSSVCVSSSSFEDAELEFEVHVVDKNVVGNHNTSSQDHHHRPTNNNRLGGGSPPGVPEVFREIQLLFQKASDSGNQLSNMLEVEKVSHRRHAPSQGSSKVSHVISSSSSVISSLSSSGNAESSTPALEDLKGVGDLEIRPINLSSTLQKCYLWEKKLYKEVKAEEKLRIIHEKNCQKLKRLTERGAEAHKLDLTRIRSLSTKLRFAIQVVGRISLNINKLRDEELWPQINELIQGLTRMWKSMLECHRSQCEAIKEARNLDAIALQKTYSDERLEATLQLERELIDWTLRFSSWIGAQKGYARALNNWLMKCLLHEPKETPDGIAPVSPGRMGAPPLFVVCNQWCKAMEELSEKEVVDSIRVFALNVLQHWEQDKLEIRERMSANKDLGRTVKSLETKDQKMHEGIQALDKMVLASGVGSDLSITEQIVYQAGTSNNKSLQANLQHIFEAMERLAANSTRAYEELLQRNQENMAAQEGHVELP